MKREILGFQITGWLFMTAGLAFALFLIANGNATALGIPALLFSVGGLELSLAPVYRRMANVQHDLETLRKALGSDRT